MSSHIFRYYSLILAILIYAAFSSPTPNNPGLAELVIAILLISSCLWGALTSLQRILKTQSTTLDIYACIALVIAGVIPALTGMLNNNPLESIYRDIIAYLFLFIPFLSYNVITVKKQRYKLWIATICIAAVSLAIRSLEHPLNIAISILSMQSHELVYFANSPLILFTAGICYLSLFRKYANNSIIIKTLSSIALVLCLTSLAITLQRASLAAFFIIALSVHITFIKQRPIKGSIIALAIFVCSAAISARYEFPLAILEELVEKTQIHGLNKREEEWRSVFDVLTASWHSTLFGNGWGAGFYSPATDGEYVFFTHSLISSMLLKTGVIGLCAFIPYLVLFFTSLYRIAKTKLALSLCLALPITIDITLYGAYKSLDFGIILLTVLIIQQYYFSGEETTPTSPSTLPEKP